MMQKWRSPSGRRSSTAGSPFPARAPRARLRRRHPSTVGSHRRKPYSRGNHRAPSVRRTPERLLSRRADSGESARIPRQRALVMTASSPGRPSCAERERRDTRHRRIVADRLVGSRRIETGCDQPHQPDQPGPHAGSVPPSPCMGREPDGYEQRQAFGRLRRQSQCDEAPFGGHRRVSGCAPRAIVRPQRPALVVSPVAVDERTTFPTLT